MGINLTLVERTILANQNRILAKLEEDNTYITKAEILENGYVGSYHKALVTDEEISNKICKETSDILQMYRVITNSYATLSDEEKETLNMDKIDFEGFDNHESHYHYACFMIEEEDLWIEHRDKDIDSHTGASIRKYRKMLNVYNQYYGQPEYDLSRDVLQEIIDEA